MLLFLGKAMPWAKHVYSMEEYPLWLQPGGVEWKFVVSS